MKLTKRERSEQRYNLLEKRVKLTEERLMLKAQDDTLSFTKWTKPDYQINWHHRIMAEKLNAFVAGDITRLIIQAPPRHGKSEKVSTRLPAYIFGKRPDAQIIATAYSSELAQKNNRAVQRVMESERYKKLFPMTRLYDKASRSTATHSYMRNSDVFEIVGHRGAYRSAGIMGAITGMGADYLIIDDPIKNREEADSPVYRDKLWEQYTSTLYTRLEKGGGICIIMTRWHEDDLVGRLLQLAESDPHSDQWDVLNLPAIKDDDDAYPCKEDHRKIGEPLWPEKYDIKRLNAIRQSIGPRDFTSLYQQRPTASAGGIVKRAHFKFYKMLPNKVDEWIQSWDAAFKDTPGSSFVVGQVWARCGADIYLVDQIRDRMGFNETISAIRQMTSKHPRTFEKLIEDKANGPAIIQTLKSQITGIIAVKPEGTKEARLSAVAPYFEAGNVYIPDPSFTPWVKDYIEELVNFPNIANNDQVDATSQALLRFKIKGSGEFSKGYVQKTSSKFVRNEDYD